MICWFLQANSFTGETTLKGTWSGLTCCSNILINLEFTRLPSIESFTSRGSVIQLAFLVFEHRGKLSNPDTAANERHVENEDRGTFVFGVFAAREYDV
jgi:hypothetical protein